MKWCVYRFLDKDNNVIYVGRAKDLNARIKTHFSQAGHLVDECYRNTDNIEYITCENIIDMNIKEMYFINKYKPKYNAKDVYEENLIIDIFENSIWEKYEIKYKYIDKIDRLNEEIKLKDKQIKQLEVKLSGYYENWIECFNEMEKYKGLYNSLIAKQ